MAKKNNRMKRGLGLGLIVGLLIVAAAIVWFSDILSPTIPPIELTTEGEALSADFDELVFSSDIVLHVLQKWEGPVNLQFLGERDSEWHADALVVMEFYAQITGLEFIAHFGGGSTDGDGILLVFPEGLEDFRVLYDEHLNLFGPLESFADALENLENEIRFCETEFLHDGAKIVDAYILIPRYLSANLRRRCLITNWTRALGLPWAFTGDGAENLPYERIFENGFADMPEFHVLRLLYSDELAFGIGRERANRIARELIQDTFGEHLTE